MAYEHLYGFGSFVFQFPFKLMCQYKKKRMYFYLFLWRSLDQNYIYLEKNLGKWKFAYYQLFIEENCFRRDGMKWNIKEKKAREMEEIEGELHFFS